MSEVHGHVTAVNAVTAGDETAAPAGPGALDLVLLDTADFDESGGWLRIGGADGPVYTYRTVDDTSDTIRLASPLADAVEEGTLVEAWEPTTSEPVTDFLATVVDDATGDVIEATVSHALLPFLSDTQRDRATESVVCVQDSGVWYVQQVLGKAPSLDGGLSGASSDGSPSTRVDDDGRLFATDADISGRLTSYQALFQSEAPANTGPANEPALRIGNPLGRHLRLDGNDLIAMDDDDTQGELYLNSGGVTRTGDLNVLGMFRAPTRFNNAIYNVGALTLRTTNEDGDTTGELQVVGGSNIRGKIRNTGQPDAGGVSIVFLDTRVGICTAGMNASNFSAGNVQSFVADQISAFNGFFDNSQTGEKAAPAYFTAGGRLVRG